MKVAIVGVGAIGGTAGAELLKANHDSVQLCVRRRFNALRVTGAGENFHTHVSPLDNPAAIRETADLVLLAVKAHQTPSAGPWLKKLCAPQTVIAVLQNGVEHVARVAPYSNGASILPVVVRLPAEGI